MEYETKVKQSKSNGWTAETTVSLGTVPPMTGASEGSEESKPGERIIKFSTGKATRGGLYTSATVCVERDTGRGYKTQSFMVFGDYSKSFGLTECKRITEKAVREVHAKNSEYFETIIEAAKEFYAKDPGNVAA